MIIVNTLFIFIKPLSEFRREYHLFGYDFGMKALDFVAVGMIVILAVMYLVTIFTDAAKYSKMDPKK